MKNKLKLLKQQISQKRKVYIPNDEISEETKKMIDIADRVGLEFTTFGLKRIYGYRGTNRFNMGDNNVVFFYPVNDGMPTCPFEFLKDNKVVMHNQNVYSEITNLDEIILQMVRIFDKALDEGIVIDPYSFMLKLNDEIIEDYKGAASLVITEKAIINRKLNERNFDNAQKYFINHFLDHFIGWNFGVSVNRCETLRNELEQLNEKVIDKGIREYAGPGFEVYGYDNVEFNGLQHYTLSKTKEKVLLKK